MVLNWKNSDKWVLEIDLLVYVNLAMKLQQKHEGEKRAC